MNNPPSSAKNMNTFSCEKCNEKFDNISLLERHENRKTPCVKNYTKINNNKYQCNFCPETFSRPDIVSNHIEKCIEKIKFDHKKEIDEYKEAIDIKVAIIEMKGKKIKMLENELNDFQNILGKMNKRHGKGISK
jgi:hypothetical protein